MKYTFLRTHAIFQHNTIDAETQNGNETGNHYKKQLTPGPSPRKEKNRACMRVLQRRFLSFKARSLQLFYFCAFMCSNFRSLFRGGWRVRIDVGRVRKHARSTFFTPHAFIRLALFTILLLTHSKKWEITFEINLFHQR